MSLEQNRKDMDNAIEKLQSATDELDGILTSDFIETFNNVINEHENLDSDITDLEAEKESLEDRITELETDLEELKKEIE